MMWLKCGCYGNQKFADNGENVYSIVPSLSDLYEIWITRKDTRSWMGSKPEFESWPLQIEEIKF